MSSRMSEEEQKPPEKVANEYHKYFNGKLSTKSKVPVRKDKADYDFSIWYTPGVAEPCKKISEKKERVYDYTNKKNMVAVVSDGTRVLGLGDIGPEAGLPVMEGKALLFNYLGGVDAVPICVDTKKKDEIKDLVKKLQPTFGGINLEDIEKPKCFGLLEELRKELDIPVWHDDQQGTALVSLAGLIGALKFVGKEPQDIKLAIGGAGAAGINNAKYSIVGGVKPENIKIWDSKGILSPTRDDLKEGDYKFEWAKKTNPEGIEGGVGKALEGADACISATTPGPGVIKKEDVEKMAEDAILFACANPVPEILPDDAREAGVRITGTGRSDYANQVNNSLGFPAVFRGALDVNASDITDEMCIAAAYAISERAEELGLEEDMIIPSMNDQETYIREAIAVAKKAMEQGVARVKLTDEELERGVREKIESSKEVTQLLMREKKIPPFPE
ncbi:malate dehydrogenase [candidate division MSBL1 archaeon SCGC-AAA259I14]|uniref:Malate dehydrogenase n=2 Tax=candidate division MSBL1 TaxID=215777 RepID=A0A133UTZ2_9EURY|nr:malate dehydrogenase [candidate division MSBL1 archaeon SCGC-AAA259E22]KXA97619.1 malate dehydrogenase [candidate division MSBL1 archaeon SCGC-AAA259I14]